MSTGKPAMLLQHQRAQPLRRQPRVGALRASEVVGIEQVQFFDGQHEPERIAL